MAKVKLTAGRIEAFSCPVDKPQAFLWDAEVNGLAVRATAGARAYIYQGRLNGKTLRVTIGDISVWSLEERRHPQTGELITPGARPEARRLQALIDQGRDPREVKAEITAADASKRAKAMVDKAPAIEAWRLYMEHCSTRQKKPWSARSRLDHERLVDPGGKPKTRGRKKGEGDTTQPGPLHDLLQLSLVKLDAEAIQAWLKENSHRPAVAEFGFARLRAFMHWCARQKAYRGQVDVEAFGDDSVREQVPELKARTDRLRRGDLKAWFAAVWNLPNPVHAAYLQITLLTGCRRGELAPLRWTDVDFTHNALRLDGKTGLRIIPMPPYIRALLVDLKRNQAGSTVTHIGTGQANSGKPSPFVFPSPAAESGYIEEPRYSHEKALQAAGVPHVSIHGLRRTFGSMSDSVGVDLPHGVVLQIQGHKPKGVAEQHYRVRELEELAPWHAKYEAWILEQAGIAQPKEDMAKGRIAA